jgi:hypothetical protein
MSQWNSRVYRLTHKKKDTRYNFEAARGDGHSVAMAWLIACSIQRGAKKKRGRRGDWRTPAPKPYSRCPRQPSLL